MKNRLRPTVIERPLLPAVVQRAVYFTSGAVALQAGQLVRVQIADSGTTWVWHQHRDALLYTFNPEHKAWKYIALVKEK